MNDLFETQTMRDISLNLNETGFLCNTLMHLAQSQDGRVPEWFEQLYVKLASANDDMMGAMSRIIVPS